MKALHVHCASVLAGIVCAAGLLGASGCAPYDVNNKYVDQPRADQGLVVILPGIEGESAANQDVREGLYQAGIPYALVIYRWGSPVPGPAGMLANQTDVGRARQQAADIASQIVQYQQKHPGKPIFIIGHSAGGGISVFILEALGQIPGALPVEGAFLLSSSISSDYNLSGALRMVRRGIVNVSNKDDELLNSGTATFGNVDGKKGPSAGRTGFFSSYPNVFERAITNAMVAQEFGMAGPAHFAATKEQLVQKYAPAWIMSPTWPPARTGTRP